MVLGASDIYFDWVHLDIYFALPFVVVLFLGLDRGFRLKPCCSNFQIRLQKRRRRSILNNHKMI